MLLRISKWGVHPGNAASLNKKVRIVNLICLLILLFLPIYLIYDLVKFPTDSLKHLSLVANILAAVSLLYLNKKGYYQVTFLILMVYVVGFYFYNTNFAYRGFYSEYFYITMPLFSILLFDRQWIHFSFFGLAILLFYVPNYYYSIYAPDEFGYTNVLFLFAIIFSVTNYFKRLNKRNERKLEAQGKREVALEKNRTLRSQIDLHFSSNTMSMVQSYLLDHDIESASKLLKVFSRVTRYTLELSRKDRVTIEEEMELMKAYLELNKISSNHSFSYSIQIDDHLEPELDTLPSMLLQPFVENAVLYGALRNEQQEGHIWLSFKQVDKKLQISVLDNGPGLPNKVNETNRKSFSGQIIDERIAVLNDLYKEKISLSVRNRQPGQIGTEVILTFENGFVAA